MEEEEGEGLEVGWLRGERRAVVAMMEKEGFFLVPHGVDEGKEGEEGKGRLD